MNFPIELKCENVKFFSDLVQKPSSQVEEEGKTCGS